MPLGTLAEEIARLKRSPKAPRPALSPGASPASAEPADPFAAFDGSVHPAALAALEAARAWAMAAARGQPCGLVLWSQPHPGPAGETLGYGCGKTHLASTACAFLGQCRRIDPETGLRRPLRVTFLNVVDFYGHLRDLYARNQPEYPLLNEWASGHLILDDLGKEYVSAEGRAWAREKLYRLLDRLYEARALLLTSNLTPAQMEASLGGAAWSRLVGMCGERGFVNMSDIPDYRLKKAGL